MAVEGNVAAELDRRATLQGVRAPPLARLPAQSEENRGYINAAFRNPFPGMHKHPCNLVALDPPHDCAVKDDSTCHQGDDPGNRPQSQFPSMQAAAIWGAVQPSGER
jgi:hypothetical protein